jgi:hypothetical protein
MARAVFGDIAFAVGMVMTDAAKVAEKLAGGDGPFFPGKGRAIFLDFGVQIELAAFVE